MDGELVVLPAPHAYRLLQRLLGELDADLLVLEQLPERVTELGGMVKQARPRVRLTRQAFENPLGDPRGQWGRLSNGAKTANNRSSNAR